MPTDPPDPRKNGTDPCGNSYTDGCLSPPPPPAPPLSPSNGHGSRFILPLVITASVLVFLAVVSLSVVCFVRRRRRRRQAQQSLLAAEAADPGVEGGGGAVAAAPAPGVEAGGAEEVVHHAWHIRTVGLDEAAIESIALTRYRAGAGMLGAADCSVCLGEFHDGELLRLLPNCGHAFHVHCIDTWLRAHVNCPLCRAQVLGHPAAGDTDPPAGANAGTVAAQAPSNADDSAFQPGTDQQPSGQGEPRVQIDQRDHSSSPSPAPAPAHQRRCSRRQSFRRVASMDSSLVPTGEALEDEQSNKVKQGNGGAAAARCKGSPRSGRLHHMERSLSGGRWPVRSPQHCRTLSSVLPW